MEELAFRGKALNIMSTGNQRLSQLRMNQFNDAGAGLLAALTLMRNRHAFAEAHRKADPPTP